MVLIVLLLLVVFGPGKAASMARDLGRFANDARRPIEELKDELASSGTEESKNEAPRLLEEQNRAVAVREEGNQAPTSTSQSEDKQRASSARSGTGMSTIGVKESRGC